MPSHLPDELAPTLIIISIRSKSLLPFYEHIAAGLSPSLSLFQPLCSPKCFIKVPSKKSSDDLNYSWETRPLAKDLPLLYTARCNPGPLIVTLVTWFYHVVKRLRRSYRHQRRLIVYLLPTMESHRLRRAHRPSVFTGSGLRRSDANPPDSWLLFFETRGSE